MLLVWFKSDTFPISIWITVFHGEQDCVLPLVLQTAYITTSIPQNNHLCLVVTLIPTNNYPKKPKQLLLY